MVLFEGGGCSACAWRVIGVPGVGDDDVVEGRMTLAEARETDLENHGRCSWYIMSCGEGQMFRQRTIFCGDHLVPPLAKDDFRDARTNAKNSHPRMHQLSLHSLLHISFATTLSFTLTSQPHDRFLGQLMFSVLIVESIVQHVTLNSSTP
jgi:hypothetical protein